MSDSRPIQKVSSPTRPTYLNGGSSNYHSNRSMNPPTITDDSGPSSSRAIRDVNFEYSSGNGNNALSQVLKAGIVRTVLFIERKPLFLMQMVGSIFCNKL